MIIFIISAWLFFGFAGWALINYVSAEVTIGDLFMLPFFLIVGPVGFLIALAEAGDSIVLWKRNK